MKRWNALPATISLERIRVRHSTLMLSLILPLAAPSDSTAGLIQNGGFESVVSVEPFPLTEFGRWGGNPANMVTTENSIVPLEGERMLWFSGLGVTTNVWQLVDVSALEAGTTLTYSVALNRVPSTGAAFLLRVVALNHGPPVVASELDGGNLLARLDPEVPANAWTPVSVDVTLPPGTVALAVEVAHLGADAYADIVSLVPEPASFVLALLGGVMAWFVYRRTEKGRKSCHVGMSEL